MRGSKFSGASLSRISRSVGERIKTGMISRFGSMLLIVRERHRDLSMREARDDVHLGNVDIFQHRQDQEIQELPVLNV
jgi:hypothetical protein